MVFDAYYSMETYTALDLSLTEPYGNDANYYQGTYGPGITSQGTAADYLGGCKFNDGFVTPNLIADFDEKQPYKMTFKTSLWIKCANSHISRVYWGWLATDDTYTTTINLRIDYYNGVYYLQFTIGDTTHGTVSYITDQNISSWSGISSGFILEITIDLVMVKNDTEKTIRPVLTIVNMDDGSEYVWDDFDSEITAYTNGWKSLFSGEEVVQYGRVRSHSTSIYSQIDFVRNTVG